MCRQSGTSARAHRRKQKRCLSRFAFKFSGAHHASNNPRTAKLNRSQKAKATKLALYILFATLYRVPLSPAASLLRADIQCNTCSFYGPFITSHRHDALPIMERFKNMVEPSLFTYTCCTRNHSAHKFAALLRWQPQYYLKFTAPPCRPALKFIFRSQGYVE